MDIGFPQHARSAKLGDLGVNIVSRIVSEEFDWLFKLNHQEHDFGIDGQVEVVTKTGAVTGQMLACQIKCGASFLKESNRWGYVYRGEDKHFNYLANYPIPVIIVICNPESKEAFWVRFCPTDTEITESGWKLTIPFGNKLASSKSELEALLPPVADYLTHLRRYWEFNHLLFGFESIVFMIDRESVESKDLSTVMHFVRRLTSSMDLALHCQGKIQFGFAGYDDDPRELFEIDSVRLYVAVLDHNFNELFFFLTHEEPATALWLFVLCIAGVRWEGERSTPGNPRKVIVDFEMLAPFFEKHYMHLNYICEWLGLPAEEVERISLSVAKTLGYPGPDASSSSDTAS
jgi:hypothetical protein